MAVSAIHAPEWEEAPPMLPDLGTAKILVVDDRPENLVAMEAILEPLGLHIVRAISGTEALKELLKHDFALILLDVQMPGMDGFETAQLIKEREKSKNIPIVFVTANNTDQEFVARGYSAGAVDYIQKPIHPEILKSKVRVFVDLYEQRQQLAEQSEQLLRAEQLEAERKLQERERALEREHLEDLRRSYHQLRQLEAERNDLTHMIVHDLRTPLTSVIGALHQLCVDEDRSPEDTELIGIAMHGANKLLRMINNLLDMAKLEAGSMQLHQSVIKACDLIDTAVKDVEFLLREKNLTVDRACVPENAECTGDDELLQRVLVNLIGNAIKFSPEGSTIRVEAKLTDSLEIRVVDRGPGIPDEAKEKVFDKFGQLGAKKGDRKISTGLGLTFCKLAVEAHGGTVWIEDNPEGGAAFVFSLPNSEAKAPEAAA